ncbi:hypothetical protein MOQ_001763, partial [Trypanosoma cruzi marinkellei]
MCVWAVCGLLVLSVPSKLAVVCSACLLYFLACVCKKWRRQQQQQQYIRHV